VSLVGTRFLDGFIHALRAGGIATSLERRERFLQSLLDLPPASIDALYWQARITLLQALDEIEPFDRLFDAWFRQGEIALVGAESGQEDAPPKIARPQPPDGAPLPFEPGEGTGRAASADDLLHRGRFQPLTRHELAQDTRFANAAAKAMPSRPAHRAKPARTGRQIDLRRTVRAAARTGGELFTLDRRDRPPRKRRLVLLVDVSGSHKGHARDHLRLARALAATLPCEVFCFGSRLTRLTRLLDRGQPERALARAFDGIPDFEGGTRIGPTLARLLVEPQWAGRLRGAVVLVLSDGLERGDPGVMAQAVERIGRLCHRLVWLTPLMRDDRFEPRTRGLLAIVPHLDRLGSAADRDAILREFQRLQSGPHVKGRPSS
jgi:uncharacterized protein with von Willebrand factor type A (vWA) domain